MTGTDIKSLREALGLPAAAFASILGVNPSTLYRWEAAGDGPVTLDPNANRVLSLLKQKIEAEKAAAASGAPVEPGMTVGAAIGTAALIGGGLFALFKLLEWLFADAPAAVKGTAATAQGLAKPTASGGRKGGGMNKT